MSAKCLLIEQQMGNPLESFAEHFNSPHYQVLDQGRWPSRLWKTRWRWQNQTASTPIHCLDQALSPHHHPPSDWGSAFTLEVFLDCSVMRTGVSTWAGLLKGEDRLWKIKDHPGCSRHRWDPSWVQLYAWPLLHHMEQRNCPGKPVNPQRPEKS